MAKKNDAVCIDPIKEFPQVENMLYDLAWRFTRMYPISFEDARSEAFAGFMKACNNYRANRGTQFSTWCYFVTWGVLKSAIMHRSACKLTFVGEITEDMAGPAPDPSALSPYWDQVCDDLRGRTGKRALYCLLSESPAEVIRLASSLSEDAKEILFLLIDTPEEIAQEFGWEQIEKRLRRRWKDYARVRAARQELWQQLELICDMT